MGAFMSFWRQFIRRRVRILTALASLSFLVLILASPLALAVLVTSFKRNWDEMGSAGSAYGGIAAVISAVALSGLAFSLIMQNVQTGITREQARRESHVEIRRMAIEDPTLLRCYTDAVEQSNLDEVKQHLLKRM